MATSAPAGPREATARRDGGGQVLAPQVSLYLDLVRVLAALAVLVSHLSLYGLTPAPLPLADLGHDAVLVFFVLSGVVIAAAASRPGITFRQFITARAVRLYSVTLAAIAVSYGLACADALHASQPLGALWAQSGGLWNLLSSVFFLNEFWLSGREVPWNAPYWSLCYEAWYYLLFGAWMFLGGRARILCMILCALLAGPRVLALMPAWLAGVALWKLLPAAPVRPVSGAVLWLLSLMTIIGIDCFQVSEAIRDQIEHVVPGLWHLRRSELFAGDYLLAAAVFVNFGSWALLGARGGRLLGACARPIRLAAGYTFSIYLFHYPLVLLLSRTMHVRATSWAQSALAGGLILLVCILLGAGTERKKDQFARFVRRSTDRWFQRVPGNASAG